MRRVELGARARRAKRAAIAQHRSQHSPLSDAAGDEAIVPPEFLTHFERDFEVFVIDPPATDQAYFDESLRRGRRSVGPGRSVLRTAQTRARARRLPRPRFRRAFEPGCATGLLTAELVDRCDEVVAWESRGAAVGRLGIGCPQSHRVEIVAGVEFRDEWPNGPVRPDRAQRSCLLLPRPRRARLRPVHRVWPRTVSSSPALAPARTRSPAHRGVGARRARPPGCIGSRTTPKPTSCSTCGTDAGVSVAQPKE